MNGRSPDWVGVPPITGSSFSELQFQSSDWHQASAFPISQHQHPGRFSTLWGPLFQQTDSQREGVQIVLFKILPLLPGLLKVQELQSGLYCSQLPLGVVIMNASVCIYFKVSNKVSGEFSKPSIGSSLGRLTGFGVHTRVLLQQKITK